MKVELDKKKGKYTEFQKKKRWVERFFRTTLFLFLQSNNSYAGNFLTYLFLIKNKDQVLICIVVFFF